VILEAKRAGDFGIEINSFMLKFQSVMARKRQVVEKLISGVEQLMKTNKVSVCQGAGRILSPHLVKVNGEVIETERVIVATGSEKALLPVPGLDPPGVLTTDNALELREPPQSLTVIGGSHVSTEFTCIFNAFGTKVTIVKRRPLQLEPVDEEIGQRFAQTLPRRGIDVKIGVVVKAIRKTKGGLKVVWDTPEGEQGVKAQMVLMATGHQPYTEGLGLSELGMKMTGPALQSTSI